MPLSKEFLAFLQKYPPLQAIGNTPLARIPNSRGGASVFAKYEHLNPGGSIKDRPVLRMLGEAILDGRLTKEKTILDATSGNAGIAYAMIGAVLGYRVALVMPENASLERKKRLLAHGAEIIFTDPMLGYDETLREVKRRYEGDPDRYFWCDQYSNEFNPQAHYDTTGEEILRQAPDITHFVAGVGTGWDHQRRRASTKGAQPGHPGHRRQPPRMARRGGSEAPGAGTHHASDAGRKHGGRDAGHRHRRGAGRVP